MSVAWNSGMRDTAVYGLSVLLRRRDWRDSESGPEIVDRLTAALDDLSPVVRMQAAGAVPLLYSNLQADERVRIVGERLLNEESPIVRATLLNGLMPDLGQAADEFDSLMEHVLGRYSGTILAATNDAFRSGVLLVLWVLATVNQSGFASRTVEEWCRRAPVFASVVTEIATHARDMVAPTGRHGHTEAFRLMGIAAEAASERWTRCGGQVSVEHQVELRGAAEVTHQIAQELYFASGAYDDKRGGFQPDQRLLQEFAELAHPLLSICARTGIAQCVHPVVETMIFLAPLDESRALSAIAEAVPASSDYTLDPLAAHVVMPYLKRLLAEQRSLVLNNAAGVQAFAHLLAAFAAAGDAEALTLAYTFGDVFR